MRQLTNGSGYRITKICSFLQILVLNRGIPFSSKVSPRYLLQKPMKELHPASYSKWDTTTGLFLRSQISLRPMLWTCLRFERLRVGIYCVDAYLLGSYVLIKHVDMRLVQTLFIVLHLYQGCNVQICLVEKIGFPIIIVASHSSTITLSYDATDLRKLDIILLSLLTAVLTTHFHFTSFLCRYKTLFYFLA